MPMLLVPLDGGEPVVLDRAILLFGRHADCDVILNASRKVSRKHCCIAQIHDYFVVRDLGSMNGVRVNGMDAGKETRLRLGDELWIGDVGFRLEMRNLERRPAPRSSGPEPGVRRVPPELLSRDVPVAIPEPGIDFPIDEPTIRAKSSKRKQKPAKPKAKPRSPQADEVIVLSDNDIID
jgi:pSer/pThr/pTyr-binding forkhead associated (FHA) protein